MPAAITDTHTQATNGTRPSPTTLTALRAVGATSISCAALTGWPTATAVHFIIYTTDTSGKKVAGSQLDCKGIVSGTTITNIQYKAGTDAGNSIGAVVEAAPTAAYANDLVTGFTAQHNQDGTHSAVTATSVSATTASTSGAATLGSVVTNTLAANGANHMSLSAGASRLVKTTALRQDDTTNTYQVGNTVILTGWGQITAAAAFIATESLTFGITFTQRPIVTVSYGGDAGSGSTTYGSGGVFRKNASAAAHTVTTTGFTVRIFTQDATNWTAGDVVFYQWTAIGEI